RLAEVSLQLEESRRTTDNAAIAIHNLTHENEALKIMLAESEGHIKRVWLRSLRNWKSREERQITRRMQLLIWRMRMKHSRLSLMRREVHSRRGTCLFVYISEHALVKNRPPDAQSRHVRGKVAAARSSQVTAAAATSTFSAANSAAAAAAASTTASPAPAATAAAATDRRAETV
ncbi:hypothetical protein PENTCL1PPCAC_24182, partial [Pristionchus entomophagus]